MRIVVTGANGQLGTETVRLMSVSGHEVYALGKGELNIEDAKACSRVIGELRPEAVLHCAAYTAVDQAESDLERAFAINADGARHMAAAAEAVGAKLCYVSTDYVFDGTSNRPYKESDTPNPRTVYGKSKLLGEIYAAALCDRLYIVRTSWLYGAGENNFVRTMLKFGRERETVKVVADQIGSPTYAYDLAACLLALIKTDRYGVYHVSNSGMCSWYDLAIAIYEECGMNVEVTPCATENFPRAAPRPKYSVLANEEMAEAGFPPMRPWRDALREYLAGL